MEPGFVSVSLMKRSVDENPDYSLTIFNDGKLVYEGRKNVKVIGKVEDFIDDSKVRYLLLEFKNSGFSHFNDNYNMDDTNDLSYIATSLSIIDEKNNIITKTVKHSPNDIDLPKELVKLENKIDEITGSDKWVDNADKKPSKLSLIHSNDKTRSIYFFKRKNLKLLSIIITVIVAVVLILYAVLSGLIDFYPSGSEPVEYIPPEITILTTAVNVSGLGNYSVETVFTENDTIYVYEEYNNIFHNIEGLGVSDFSVNITILNSLGAVRYYDSVDVYYEDKIEEGRYWTVETDESWTYGWYLVNSSLTDHISKKSTSKEALFLFQ